MSGSTIIASTLPVAVLCTGPVVTAGVDPESIAIEGKNGPNAVNGVGITYDVDIAAFDFWIAGQVEVGLQVAPISQADLDTLTEAQGMYGFELGLTPPGTLAAEGVFDLDPTGANERDALRAAASRQRQAEQNLHAIERQRKMLEQQAEAAETERKAAEDNARAATEAVEKRQAEVQQPRQEGPGPERTE
jgi:hypothetical protein